MLGQCLLMWLNRQPLFFRSDERGFPISCVSYSWLGSDRSSTTRQRPCAARVLMLSSCWPWHSRSKEPMARHMAIFYCSYGYVNASELWAHQATWRLNWPAWLREWASGGCSAGAKQERSCGDSARWGSGRVSACMRDLTTGAERRRECVCLRPLN
jgi:hypothetical protein